MQIKTIYLLACCLLFSGKSYAFILLLDATPTQISMTHDMHVFLKTIRDTIQTRYDDVQIIIPSAKKTHSSVDSYTAVASFSNRMEADLHVCFNFLETQKETSLYVYSFATTSPETTPTPDALQFIPAEKVGLCNAHVSKKYSQIFATGTQDNGSSFCKPPHTLPLLPLQEIVAPSFLLEVSTYHAPQHATRIAEGIIQVIATAKEGK